MICYRDMTFCPYSSCVKFAGCPRALTEEVLTAARRWFYGDNPPICQYAEHPECYTEDNNGN